MADSRARNALKIGDDLFSKKRQVDSLWEEIALNFYPEQADFTTVRDHGEEYADHLFSSVPALARRELGNVLFLFLYSRATKKFSIHVEDEDLDQRDDVRKYLETLSDIQWRAMYDPLAGFARDRKQTAHDFAAFGNSVTKFGLNIAGDGLLYRNYHLRDNAWSENAEGNIDANHRNWKPTARQLMAQFPETVSADVRKAFEKDPEQQFACRHVVLPGRLYDFKSRSGRTFPFVSLYVERESETVLEETGLNSFCYNIPRWSTVPNSQYGLSMATSLLLPDGRTMQAVVRTIREAGEKYTDPPMLAVTEAIRGDIALYAGGVTTADIEYDERLGEVLRPITQDKGSLPVGMEIAAALQEDIRHGFFLDKIQLPSAGTDMTAFEIRRRLEEHIRGQAPIFDPIEEQVSPLYESTFEIMSRQGSFSFQDMPEELQGRTLRYKFRSPLTDMQDVNEAETYLDVRDRILAPTAQFDPAQLENVDWTEATRDAMRAAGWKAKWFKDKGAVQKRRQQMDQQAQAEKAAQDVGMAGEAAEQAGRGAQELAKVDG